MKITRTLSSIRPENCSVIAKGFFGNIIGEVKYSFSALSGLSGFEGSYGIQMLDGKPGYFVIVRGRVVGAATDFHMASDMLMGELKVFQTVFV